MSLSRTIRNWWFQILLLVGISLLLFRGCQTNGFFGETVVSTTKDSTYTKGSSDTVYVTQIDTVYRTEDFHHWHTDTVWNKDTSDWNVGYMYEKKDSTIDATIGVWTKEKPDSITFQYKASIPTITRVDTIKKTLTEKIRVSQVYLGPEAIVYPGFRGGFVTMDFIHRKGWQLEAGVGYGTFEQSSGPVVKIGYKQVISFRKKK